jgi:hypothetical protein
MLLMASVALKEDHQIKTPLQAESSPSALDALARTKSLSLESWTSA